MKGGIFNPALIVFYLLPTIIILISSSNYNMFLQNFVVYVDIILTPVVMTVMMTHFIRERQVTIFELNLVKSYRIIFLSKIISFLIASAVQFIPLFLILYFQRLPSEIGIAILSKILMYTMILSVGIVLAGQRSTLIFFILANILLPYIPSAMLGRALTYQYTLDPLSSVFSYTITPILATTSRHLLSISLPTVQVASTVLCVVIILICYIIYMRREWNV
ncbi:hypothetical protein SUSAZ_08865 [Sulfolobus acidocaldarius SUSAZ]|nr:hypothetical protein SUSAZ_08865 [Sulfolobus acidocaldarius SUSAZ]